MIETLLVVTSGLLWLLMVALAGAGYWLGGLYVLLLLLLVYGILGTSHKGRFDLRLVLFPTSVWLLSWAGAFGLGEYFARAYDSGVPAFTIFGFHPSFAAIIALFWVFPTLLMGFGFEAVKDRWLSQKRWDDFLEGIHDAASDEQDDEQDDERT